MQHLLLALLLVFATWPLPAQGQGSAEVGSFLYTHAQDDFTDEDRSYVITMDEDGDGGLGWKCLADGLNVILGIGGYMGGDSDDDIRVRYRFDRREPSGYEYWGLSSSNKVAFMRMNRVLDFTAEARRSSTVVVEAVDPLDGETRRFHFDLEGAEAALDRLPCAAR